MNFYPHHIGDFNSATRHLNRIERSVYRDLIEFYYDTEQALPTDIKSLCRKILANTPEETKAVEQVLAEFFKPTENGWYHERCESVILDYKGKSQLASESAIARWQKQKGSSGDANAMRTHNERNAKAMLTKNQEPRTKNQDLKTTACAEPLCDSTPKAGHAQSTGKVFISIPILGDQVHSVTESEVLEYEQAYPAVDVKQSLRHMRQWCLANPKRRKTQRGVRGFITGWLGREQDRGGNKNRSETYGTNQSNFKQNAGVSKAREREIANREAISKYLAKAEATTNSENGG